MNIKTIRQQAGLSQAELGKRVGLDQATISRMERGQREPTVSQLQRIAEACGYELDLKPRRAA